MNVEISSELFEAIGAAKLKPYGVDKENTRWGSTSISLLRHSNSQVKTLAELVEPHAKKNLKGARNLLRDLQVWIEAATKGAENVRCKSVKQFASLVYEYMQKQPKHWLYQKDDAREVWRAYYLGKVVHVPKVVDKHGVTPAHTILTLFYVELGVRDSSKVTFEDHEVKGLTVPEILTSAGLMVETPELESEYLADMARYESFHDKVGMQFHATGVGTTNLDGNDELKGWRSWGFDTVRLERDGERARVVIDVRWEEDKTKEQKDDHFDRDFWTRRSLLEAEDDAEPNDIHPEDVDSEEEQPEEQIPTFPVVPTFDLRRHMRMRVHIANLEEYRYNPKLGDKLVLPSDSRMLIEMLLKRKATFSDIIAKKGGGATILCAGPPGVGKTLTAEVFAEVDQRALYSVQCSQLGTDENALESALMKAFARAYRWNAILLLDESDVYVAARGKDLKQNAIVGVFLRVLEYYQGVLFMTTNRSDLVDDAILSRCIARLDYQVPTKEEQARIWHILSEVSGVRLAPGLVEAVVEKYPRLSGRDVKQLLKLASMLMASREEQQVTVEHVEFAKRFKPTGGVTTPASTPGLPVGRVRGKTA